jgi:hypothetical protein
LGLQVPFVDPVIDLDGYTYERAAIAQRLQWDLRSPLTGQTLASAALRPNHAVRAAVESLL